MLFFIRPITAFVVVAVVCRKLSESEDLRRTGSPLTTVCVNYISNHRLSLHKIASNSICLYCHDKYKCFPHALKSVFYIYVLTTMGVYL